MIIDANSMKVSKSYGQRLTASGVDDSIFDMFFLGGDTDDIRNILDWGADPNKMIDVWGLPSEFWEKLYERPTLVNHYCGTTFGPSDTDQIRAVLARYNRPLKIPGFSRILDIQRLQQEIELVLKKRQAQGKTNSGYIFPVQHQIQPLAIAVLKGNLEAIRLLLATGARADVKLPNGLSLFDVASDSKTYHALRAHDLPFDHLGQTPLEQTLANDDPEALAVELNALNKKEYMSSLPDVLKKAEQAGSMRVIDMLFRGDNVRYNPKSPDPLVRAYLSGNPLLLAFYLSKGVHYDSFYSIREYMEDGGDQPLYLRSLDLDLGEKKMVKMFNFFHHEQKVGQLHADEIENQSQWNKSYLIAFAYARKKRKTGEILLDAAKDENRWSVAFVLEDHVSKWSNLHLAVLAEDEREIRGILQAEPGRIEERDARGRTPLALAACYQCNTSYQVLMDFNPDFDAEDHQGYAPLTHAATYGNKIIVKDLLARGAKLNFSSRPDCAMVRNISSANKLAANKLSDLLATYRPAALSSYAPRDALSPYVDITKDINSTWTMIDHAAEQASLPECQ
jgi:hypothetical protein